MILKLLKKIFYGLAILTLLLSGAIIFLSFHPLITEDVAEKIDDIPKLDIDIGPTPAPDGDTPVDGSVLEPVPDEPPIHVQTGPDAGINWDKVLQISGDTYTPPIHSVTAPGTVSGKNGYLEVQDEPKEVEDQEAALIENKLDWGNTGSELVFPEVKYPYYAMLTSDMQSIYRQIYANALDVRSSFAPIVKVSVNQLKNVFEAVYNDHPEVFWLETEYSCKYKRNGSCVEISLKFNETADNLEKSRTLFEQAASKILNNTRRYTEDIEKEQYVHDALAQLVEYDAKSAMNQSAYSALVLQRSVCAGYARAFQYLMQQLDIPCYYCGGYSGEKHAWNIIRMEDGFWNVDVTWADTNPINYEYYNKTDAEYSSGHVRRGLSVYLPACNGSGSPNKPLDWEEEKHFFTDAPDSGMSEEEKNLEEAGIKAEDVLKTLEDYYKDCLSQLKEEGPGSVRFSNVVPESLWDTVENAYSVGDYKKGYLDEGIKAIGMDGAVIQLQVVKLGGGYYRIYHNIRTYK